MASDIEIEADIKKITGGDPSWISLFQDSGGLTR
jgi:hypothetical protein